MSNGKKYMLISLLLLAVVVSVTQIAPRAADPANHKHSVEQTEKQIESVIKLSGGAAATSASLSLLPGDLCTPLAEQLAEMATYFLLILSALYLEKSLISLSGYITFTWLIPIACVLLGIALIRGQSNLYRTAAKLSLIGMIIFLIVPASVKLSDMVYDTQAEKVNNTIEEYNALDIEGDAENGLFNEITSVTTEMIDNITDFIDNLLESLAVMIVTSCVIPLLVFAFLIWMVKAIFSANILVMDPSSLESLAGKLRLHKKNHV